MWELDHKESWALKNWCFWTGVLEKTLESPLDCKEIKPVEPKGNQPEYSLEGLMRKLKLQYFGLLMQRADSLEKALKAGKIEGIRKGATDDKIVGWHHQLNRQEFALTQEDSEGQKSLACCRSQGCRELAQLSNWTTTNNNKYFYGFLGGSDGKEPACNTGGLGSIPGLGRCPGKGNDYPLQYSCLYYSMDRGVLSSSWK